MQVKKTKYPRINYRINFCSNEDADYPSSQLLLQSPECKGWQTARYCTYPQTIILEAMEPVKLRQITVLSHQHKIATRIEIEYRLTRDQPFKRLGHFSFSSNESTNFSVRQLKNIPMEIACTMVKLTLHKNHQNKYNVFNQVGLISVCLFGEKLIASVLQSEPERQDDASRHQVQFDRNTMSRLQELENTKKRAVADEDYETAKQIKIQIENLKKIGSHLSDLEKRKKIAVEREDYDSAKLIQQEIKRILNGEKQQPKKQEEYRPKQEHYKPKPTYDEENKSPMTKVQKKEQPKQQKSQPVPQKVQNPDDRPINGSKKPDPLAEYAEEEQQTKEVTEAEQLKGDAAKIAAEYRDYVSQDTFRKIFSKNYANREQGLEEVKEIVSGPMHPDKNGMVQAILAIVKSTIDDKITNVLLSSMELFQIMLKKFKPMKEDQTGQIDYILSKLSDYQGHSNEKVKLSATQLFTELPGYGITNKNICIRSLITTDSKKPPNPKILCGRLETLSTVVEEFKAGNNFSDCAQFGVKYVDDKSSEVRNSSMNLLRVLIEEVGYHVIAPFLKNVRGPIVKSIEAMVQDEVPTNHENVPIPSKKQQKFQQPEYAQPKKQSKQPAKVEPAKNAVNPEYTCEFCGKFDKNLIDENYRDIHLFNACPMLVLCQCQQAVEIDGYTSHLLSECKNSKYYKRCPRCKEAIHQRNFRTHVEAKECNPAKPVSVANRCPLCHEDIDYGKEGWRKHLATEGCPNHNRGN